MSFSSGSITFKRFFVNGPSYARVDEALLEQVQARATGANSVRTSDKTEIGWTTGEHILDTEFNFEKNAIADGLHFAMRVDTNKVPTELVRSYQKINEQAMLEASGRQFISKAERREAREQALARADMEARSGTYRRMKQVAVFWDLKRNEVYLGSAGSAVIDHFILLFRETFDRSVVAATAGEIAARWSAMAGETRSFDDCEPAHWINPPDGAETGGDMMPVNEARSKDFLGTEWLSWLWYSSHVESPEITTQLAQSVTVLFEKSLQLECAFKISGSLSIRSDAPTRLPESPIALAGGKRPVRAGLHVASSGGVFNVSIRGDAMNYAGVQVPAPEDAGSPRMIFEDRIEKLRDLIVATNDLYGAFLRRRMSNKWPQILNAIRTWIANGQAAPSNIRVAS